MQCNAHVAKCNNYLLINCFHFSLNRNCHILHCLRHHTQKHNMVCLTLVSYNLYRCISRWRRTVLSLTNRCHYPCDPRRSNVRRPVNGPAGVWIAPPDCSPPLPRRTALDPPTSAGRPIPLPTFALPARAARDPTRSAARFRSVFPHLVHPLPLLSWRCE